MSKPLDTKKLKKLCEDVVRDCANGDEVHKAQDEMWASLGHSSYPALREFIMEQDDLHR